MNNVSFLLGAGFSIPLGYPSANKLNNQISSLEPENFSIQSDGTLGWLKSGEEDPNWYSSSVFDKLFFLETIKLFESKFGEFKYEDYYDFLYKNLRSSQTDKKLEEFTIDFIKRHKIHEITNNSNLLSTALRTLNQAVAFFLVDNNKKQFYEGGHYMYGTPSEHCGILNAMHLFGKEYKVQIHTLNHDLVFERYKYSDYFNGELSDGFEEFGSPYYCKMTCRELKGKMVRISHFVNKYDKKFNLFKLHSSIDYYPFYEERGTAMYVPNTFVKTDMPIRPNELYKEIEKDGKLEYFQCWINYKPDFLSGTTSKILRYNDKVYFNEVFQHFESNLQKAEKLIVVGYGCNDSEVNNIIYKNFKIGEKQVYVFALNITPEIEKFIQQTKAIHIPKYVQDIIPSDII